MNQPLVSIIIPTYNRADLILETLQSVQQQTYSNWECIIVDDGSTDKTKEVVSNFIKQDTRFQYHMRSEHHKPGGNGARNFGFIISKGKFVNWLDSDDLISNNKIENQIKKLVNKEHAIATCKWKRFLKNPDDKDVDRNYIFLKDYINPKNILTDFGLANSFLVSHNYLVARSIVFKSGLWNEDLKINQDGEFFCRIILNSSKIYYDDTSLVYYRVNTNSTSSYSNILKAKHAILSWKLIESYLEIADISNSMYVENAKNYMYSKLKNNYFNIIKLNSAFFCNQIKQDTLFNKFFNKFLKL